MAEFPGLKGVLQPRAKSLMRTGDRGSGLLLQLMLIVGPLLVLGLLYWGRNRGFDITDEGMYLLMAQHPEQVTASATLVYVYLAPLFRLAGENIGTFRALGYLLILVSALVLWHGVRRVAAVRVPRTSAVAGAGMTVSGALLFYVWFLPTPSYNLLNTVVVYLYAGALLSGLAALDTGRHRTARVAWLLAGITIGIGLFVKFPTAVFLLLLAGTAAALWPELNLKTRLLQFGLVVGGMLVWIGFHVLVLQPPMQMYAVFTRGLDFAVALDGRYTTGDALRRILTDSWTLVTSSVGRFKRAYLVAGIAMAVFSAWPGPRERRVLRVDWMLALLGPVLIYMAASAHWYRAGFRYITETTPLIGGVLALGLLWRGWRAGLIWGLQISSESRRVRWRWVLVLLFLVGLPFAAAVGTNNLLYVNMTFCMAPWSLALWLIFASTDDQEGQNVWRRWVLPGFLVGLCSTQVFYGCLTDPYRLPTGLTGQNQPTIVGAPGSTLYLDQASSRLLIGLRRAAAGCGLDEGHPVLAFYNAPGLVYALGAVSPGIPWYLGTFSSSNPAMALALKYVPPATVRRAAVMTLARPPIGLQNIAGLGLPPTAYYRKCATFSSLPYPTTVGQNLTLWVPATKGT